MGSRSETFNSEEFCDTLVTSEYLNLMKMEIQRVNEDEMIHKTASFVKDHMSCYDSSHDYEHVKRTVRYAQYIAITESRSNGSASKYDPFVVTLAAYLHDIGDRKYLSHDEDGTQEAARFLESVGMPLGLREKVQDIVNAVSYSGEVKDPSRVVQVLQRHPELGPVQDADRLDALGAVGLGRCFVFRGARGGMPMATAIDHIDEKLLKLEEMMKTTTGKRLARSRTEKLVLFKRWWEEEVMELESLDVDALSDPGHTRKGELN